VRDDPTQPTQACARVSHASTRTRALTCPSGRREEVTFSGCGPLALSLSLCLSLQRKTHSNRKNAWTLYEARAGTVNTVLAHRRLAGGTAVGSGQVAQEVTFSGCGPLALSLSLCLSLQRKTHSNRKNGAKSPFRLDTVRSTCGNSEHGARSSTSGRRHSSRIWTSRRAASLAESLAAVGPKDRGQGIVTARDRVVRRSVEDSTHFAGAFAPLRTTWTCTTKASDRAQEPVLMAESLAAVGPKDRGQGIVTARDRVVRRTLRKVYDATTAFSPGHCTKHVREQ
jgi:hypothetical protein